jgi:hypothetical protein
VRGGGKRPAGNGGEKPGSCGTTTATKIDCALRAPHSGLRVARTELEGSYMCGKSGGG